MLLVVCAGRPRRRQKPGVVGLHFLVGRPRRGSRRAWVLLRCVVGQDSDAKRGFLCGAHSVSTQGSAFKQRRGDSWSLSLSLSLGLALPLGTGRGESVAKTQGGPTCCLPRSVLLGEKHPLSLPPGADKRVECPANLALGHSSCLFSRAVLSRSPGTLSLLKKKGGRLAGAGCGCGSGLAARGEFSKRHTLYQFYFLERPLFFFQRWPCFASSRHLARAACAPTPNPLDLQS